jgi:hypothetical protein
MTSDSSPETTTGDGISLAPTITNFEIREYQEPRAPIELESVVRIEASLNTTTEADETFNGD